MPDGRLARFYELRSNKPLYFTRDYQLTYDDADMPTHYSFKVPDGSAAILREYERLRASGPEPRLAAPAKQPTSVTPQMRAEVESILAAQDARGRWVETGGLRYHQPKNPAERILDCATFVRNVETLSRFLAASRSLESRPAIK